MTCSRFVTHAHTHAHTNKQFAAIHALCDVNGAGCKMAMTVLHCTLAPTQTHVKLCTQKHTAAHLVGR